MFGSSLNTIRICLGGALLLTVVQVVILLSSGAMLSSVVALAALVFSAIALIYVAKVSRNIKGAVSFCRKVESGDFETRITNIDGKGEIAEMLWAMNGLVDRMDAFVREAMASMEAVSDNRFYRRILEQGMVGTFLHASQTINNATGAMEKVSNRMIKMGDELEETVGNGVTAIYGSAYQIMERTKNMGNRIDRSSTRSVDVAKAAQRTNETVQIVAEATSQLSASITEISSQVNQSASIARDAVTNAQAATNAMDGLNVAADKIGEVVQLITAIAEQTNLLALNATIEAARAGDAGKGFAVVAGEVKNLANQTARATEEIAQQIGGIQSATEEASDAISSTGRTISQIDEIATAIASAVEEQGASTENIASNMQEVAENSEMVRSRIVKVNQGSATSYSAAIRVMWAARDLNKPAQELDDEVKAFLKSLRTQ
ncbi:Methyl-accepting chemotaxis protein [Candidatus Terasakiella magnetica]|uniref:Methyl-accepting chemotaxis protein n=1 Tax=Candidatus Terasakiella magnetica TaxID=1867952 RepID=A0A1C3RI77_9PROT|nr:methyl-accepting chemotaxis protein [Candidatus Terasakiella magnetica]SCA56924.1 Methyl-accepting chemotaxis protein [Candidatus Terasakiella magnetica]